jgi:hypothetical protein
MSRLSQQFHSLAAPHSAADLIDTTARWFSIDDDVALGCECADPSLQIERWGQEAVPLPMTPAVDG